jgi:hypothetical protein
MLTLLIVSVATGDAEITDFNLITGDIRQGYCHHPPVDARI